MLNKYLSKDFQAFLIAFFWLVLGIGVIIVARAVGVTGEVTLVVLLVLPILIYFGTSGRISEFTAGGVSAKFAQTTSASAWDGDDHIVSIEPTQEITKGGVSPYHFEQIRSRLEKEQSVTLTLTLGGSYQPKALLQYLDVLNTSPDFKFVVFKDRQGQFVAYAPHWLLERILNQDELGYEFVDAINQNEAQKLLLYPGIIKNTITTKATNKDALTEMMNQGLEAILVIDENKQLKGIVEREQVLSRMMLALAK